MFNDTFLSTACSVVPYILCPRTRIEQRNYHGKEPWKPSRLVLSPSIQGWVGSRRFLHARLVGPQKMPG